MQYKCEICDKDFDTLWGLSSHNIKKHDIYNELIFLNIKQLTQQFSNKE